MTFFASVCTRSKVLTAFYISTTLSLIFSAFLPKGDKSSFPNGTVRCIVIRKCWKLKKLCVLWGLGEVFHLFQKKIWRHCPHLIGRKMTQEQSMPDNTKPNTLADCLEPFLFLPILSLIYSSLSSLICRNKAHHDINVTPFHFIFVALQNIWKRSKLNT